VQPGEDDVAAWREADGSITLATCDTFVEGVHFDLGWMQPADVGWRACALTLNDLAAKGARPTFGLSALGAPKDLELAVVEGLFGGLAECAEEFGLRLAGGDTTAAPVLSLTICALGRTAHDPLPRSAVRPGWLIGVTGPLGGEAVALAERRATRPRPRFGAAPPGAACGDVSDGLLREVAKFRQAAGVGATIDSAALPVAAGATRAQALTGGEEAELVCGWPGGDLGLTAIGRFTEDRRILVDGEEVSADGGGYDHFA
jgi:thiamine-monophosphate kinase